MIIKSVKLTNFRSHKEYFLECDKNTTLIIGENGLGKTSVLEAINIAMRGKSFRAADGEILKRGEDFYRIELNYNSGEKIAVTFDGQNKIFIVGDKKWRRLPKTAKYPVVLFLPEDLHLIDASPITKREYFDRFLGQLDEKYNNDLAKYNKALKQRNEALKSDFLKPVDVFSWNILLAKYGAAIMGGRKEMEEEINKRLTMVYRSIAENDDEVKIRYKTESEMSESQYLAKLEADFERDRILGHTGFGVHKDNYDFVFNNSLADGSASRGEVRSIVLALKFIEAELVFEWLNKKPVVLLDDVFSELDKKRQKCLVKNFEDNQVIITSVEGV